jgi:iron-sulfur cluster repair protein YtfE (RIC family)
VIGIVKYLLKAVWRRALPMRMELAERFDQHLDEQLDGHLRTWISHVERVYADHQQNTAELQLVTDAMVRELVRLQSQIQGLQQAVERQSETNAFTTHEDAGRRQVA